MFPITDRARTGRRANLDDGPLRASQPCLIGNSIRPRRFGTRCAFSFLIDDQASTMQVSFKTQVEQPNQIARAIFTGSEFSGGQNLGFVAVKTGPKGISRIRQIVERPYPMVQEQERRQPFVRTSTPNVPNAGNLRGGVKDEGRQFQRLKHVGGIACGGHNQRRGGAGRFVDRFGAAKISTTNAALSSDGPNRTSPPFSRTSR
jgi:hypothetical protein